jgi:hypothetical protein
MRCIPKRLRPGSLSSASRPPTAHRPGQPTWPAGPLTCAPSRWSRWRGSAFRTPPRSSRSPARPATWTAAAGAPWSFRGHQPGPSPGQPARLTDLIRGHRQVEHGLHHGRDVTFAEDGSQLRAGAGPQVMACPQPDHRRAQPRRAGQHRSRAAPPRPRPTTTTRHPRDQPRMKRTRRENAGARAPAPNRRGSHPARGGTAQPDAGECSSTKRSGRRH